MPTRSASTPPDEDGYRLWLRNAELAPGRLRSEYRALLPGIELDGESPQLELARAELALGLSELLGTTVNPSLQRGARVLLGTPASSERIRALGVAARLAALGDEAYIIRRAQLDEGEALVIAGSSDRGVLYGAFHLLRQVAIGVEPAALEIESAPRIRHRLLNHWDNLDGSIERGYAGSSLWDWHKLPYYVSPRYRDYARANASIGINGAVLTNVNANALVLTAAYLAKVAALADVFRPYGIRVYLTARFSAPIEIGGLSTADPLDANVRAFWHEKVAEIYQMVPDFGGLLVKANSEGQPGPQSYGRTHAEGANLLADALRDHGGLLYWRAFVYDDQDIEDRAKQAYNEFSPLDSEFRDNVLVQVKNGPIDFQPREPFHPLLGGMKNTRLSLEVQLTQEYLGCATHLAYLAPLLKECLETDTFANGPGSLVAHVIDGSLPEAREGAIAGVANIGSERNWCGHPLAQSNWYAFGRLAWDPCLGCDVIAEEWIRLTFSRDEHVVSVLSEMLLASREAVVNYMTPLGLHHLMAWDHHYGPGPWIDSGRVDWTSVYFHRADAWGIGFDRTETGSNAVAQYHPEVAARFGDLERCPEALLLWFHRVSWQHRLRSGRSLWEALCLAYQSGVDAVRRMQVAWDSLEGRVDKARFQHVRSLFQIQERESCWWRDACLLYFQTFSKQPLSAECETPQRTLEEYRNIRHHYVPGTPNGS